MIPRSPTVLLIAAMLIGRAPASAQDPFASCAGPGKKDDWSSCYFEVAQERNLWEEAASRLEAHRAALIADDPKSAYYLAHIRLQSQEILSAEGLYSLAAQGFASRGDSRMETLARLNRVNCLHLVGHLEEGIRELEKAEAAAKTSGESRFLLLIQIQRASFLHMQGRDLEHALQILRQVERQMPPASKAQDYNRLFFHTGSVLRSMGRYREALANDTRWAEWARSLGFPSYEATARVNMAVNFIHLPPASGAQVEARRMTRQALDLSVQSHERFAEATAREYLGKLLANEEGRAHLEECLNLTRSAGAPLKEAGCLFALAGSLAADQPEAARSHLSEALTRALASEEPWTAAQGWAERFRVQWSTLPREEAIADSLTVLDLIEALRRLQDSETGRADLFTDWTEVYYSLVGHLLSAEGDLRPDDLETAFSVAERMRARVLLDALSTAGALPPPKDEAAAMERTTVLQGIVRVQRRLQSPTLDVDERAGLLAELDRLELALAEVEDRLDDVGSLAVRETGSPGGGQVRDFAPLREVEATLGPDEAMLSFLVGLDEDIFGKFAGGSWLFVSTRDGTQVVALPGRLDLEPKIEIFLGLMEPTADEQRDDSVLDPGAVVLYDELLADALEQLPPGIEELILVPDGVLHLLPFGLLRPHAQMPRLAERYRLSSVPSATLWRFWQTRTAGAVPPAALAFADPAFPSSDGTADPADDRLWALETGKRLGRLPRAEREGRALVRRLGGPPSRLLLGDEATERHLKSASLAEFGVLHFAAHTLLDEERPHRSAVLLAAGGEEEDGLLQPREIVELDLDGKLVVLSACNGASGKVLLGEGVDGLTKAFFRAGAQAVVANLWRLGDADAEAFFDPFYRALARGESVAEAVAHARRTRLGAGAPAAAWAGILVLGDGDLVPVPGGVEASGWPTVVFLLAIALAAALLLLAALSVRRRISGRT